ncbi:MAG: hypothetical protein K2X32_11020, partial [Phycisphaerales bacterium]|nr:hypothetical protein [Phycisphaerales bacterium]
LVICDGSLPSLAALWSEARSESRVRASGDAGGSVIAWGIGPANASEAWHELVRRQAQACGVSMVEFAPTDAGFSADAAGSTGSGARVKHTTNGFDVSRMLLSAGEAALDHHVGRVVWPVALGMVEGAQGAEEAEMVINAISGAADRALLCSRLLALESDDRARREGGQEFEFGGRFMIQTPYLDLGENQLVELALDMDVPLSLVDSQACAGNARWLQVIERVGAATLIRPAA